MLSFFSSFRASLRLCGFGLILFFLAFVHLSGVAQQPRPRPESIRGLERSTTARSELAAVLAHVEPGQDGFITERYNEEIQEVLHHLKEIAKHKPLDTEQLAALLAADFRAAWLQPERVRPLRQAPPAVLRYPPNAEPTLTADTFPDRFRQWLAPFQQLHIELKTTTISVEQPDPPEVSVRIRYDFTGRTPSGEVRQWTGHWRTRWRQDPQRGWLWVGLELEESWEGRTPRPHFTDVTRRALGQSPAYQQFLRGIDWYSAHVDIATLMGVPSLNGVAVADIDADGDEDFYVCQPPGLPNRLFRSNGDGTFTDISRQAGVDVLDSSASAVFFDYDNDGDPDLLIAGLKLLLFENDGRGRFTFHHPEQVGLAPPMDKTYNFYSLCVTDYNRDGWLDFYVCAYTWQVGEGSSPDPLPFYDAQNGPPNYLFRNNGDGTFTDATREVGLDHNNNRLSLACAWGDHDRDGWPDLYVANDFGRNNFYRNENGHFRDVAGELGIEDIGAGMSVTWGDYDNDGWLDLYVANMWSSAGLRTTMQPIFKQDASPAARAYLRRMAQGNALYRNRGDGTFEEVTDQAGAAFGRWSWSSQFFDLDLDGREDLYVMNGYVTGESTRDL